MSLQVPGWDHYRPQACLDDMGDTEKKKKKRKRPKLPVTYLNLYVREVSCQDHELPAFEQKQIPVRENEKTYSICTEELDETTIDCIGFRQRYFKTSIPETLILEREKNGTTSFLQYYVTNKRLVGEDIAALNCSLRDTVWQFRTDHALQLKEC